MKQCTTCGSSDVVSNTVDDRKVYYCQACNTVTYETRKSTGRFLQIADDITEGVRLNGTHRAKWVILLNSLFKVDSSDSTPERQLMEWAPKNYLSYDFEKNGDYVVFRRSKPVVPVRRVRGQVFSEYVSVRGIGELVQLCAIERAGDFKFVAYIGRKRIPYPEFTAPKSLSSSYSWGYAIYKSWLLSNPNALAEILKKAGYSWR